MSPPILHNPTSGFTALPRRLLDAALCSDMSKRELYTWLLVARLTYGAQGRRWIALRPADLRVIGIGPNHARAVLEGMLGRNLLQNGEKPEYRIAAPEPANLFSASVRQQRLNQIVARQIGATTTTPPLTSQKGGTMSQKGAIEYASTPKIGNQTFPKREENGSQEGNASTVPLWAFSRSQRRFVKKVGVPIDSVKTKINKPPSCTKEPS